VEGMGAGVEADGKGRGKHGGVGGAGQRLITARR